ncbi:hypothetical protein BHM03_00035499 [Ensete ventricosum]|nr:hypothetical protein BHM03_00035499 [Ensete ventricosum]
MLARRTPQDQWRHREEEGLVGVVLTIAKRRSGRGRRGEEVDCRGRRRRCCRLEEEEAKADDCQRKPERGRGVWQWIWARRRKPMMPSNFSLCDAIDDARFHYQVAPVANVILRISVIAATLPVASPPPSPHQCRSPS